MSGTFEGSWLVSEYVFNPDGSFAGIIRQRRMLESIPNGRIRVTQVCEPEERLSEHPMGAFSGRWEFELEAEEQLRRYLGPDVVGYGTEWSPGTMTGQGIWPRFGHTFESYAVLLAKQRQVTGGFFSLSGRSVADIVGAAVESADDWPELDIHATPPPLPLREEYPFVQRRIGPMAVAESWPSPTERVRFLGIGSCAETVTIIDRLSLSQRSVEVSRNPI